MKYFSKLIWLVFENHGYSEVFDLPSHKHLAQNGVIFTNYFAATHPSGPNYRILASGNIQTPTEECNTTFVNLSSTPTRIFNLSKDYIATRHNPFLNNNCITIQKGSPDLFIPDEIPSDVNHVYLGFDDFNNAHSGPLYTADLNLSKVLYQLENSKWFDTQTNGLYPLFAFVWDESFLNNNNQVFCAFYSHGLTPGINNKRFDHYDFNRTMTTILELPVLGDTEHSQCMVN